MPDTKAIGIAYRDPAIVNGSIDATPIGATTPSTVVATVLTYTTRVGSNGTVAAAGSTNADAAVIPAGTSLVVVTAADGTKGVILPTMVPGQFIAIKNNSAAILKVYPPAGAAINALAVTTGALSFAAGTMAYMACTGTTQIYSMPLLPS